ncbi:MAG: PIN domain-containing protein [Planctomycetota bacterium]
MNVLDTNTWIYSHDTRDPVKQQKALVLIATLRPLALPWQVGCEFIAASRKLSPCGFTEVKAWTALQQMQNLVDKVLIPDVALWPLARTLKVRYQLPFWDALLVAACIREGATDLYSEDFQDGIAFGNLRVRNPFK